MPSDMTWAASTETLVRKLEVAAMLGCGFQFNHEGTKALAGLLKEMSAKLDLAVRLQCADGPSDE